MGPRLCISRRAPGWAVPLSLPYLTRPPHPQLHCPVSVACGCGQDTAVLRQTGQTRAPQSVRGVCVWEEKPGPHSPSSKEGLGVLGTGTSVTGSPGHQPSEPQASASIPGGGSSTAHWPHVWLRMSFWNCQGVSAPRHQVCWWRMLSVTLTSSGALSPPVPVSIPP